MSTSKARPKFHYNKIYLAISLLLLVALCFTSYVSTTVKASSLKPRISSVQNNFLDIKKENGHYRTVGAINGIPARFLIDTGASFVSLSSSMAFRSGIRVCRNTHRVSTANGFVNACATKVANLTIGPFMINSVDVLIMPNMAEDALLGMNILECMHISQNKNIMRITNTQNSCIVNSQFIQINQLGSNNAETNWEGFVTIITKWDLLIKLVLAGLSGVAFALSLQKKIKDRGHLKSELLRACRNDSGLAARLVEHELKTSPLISYYDAIERAIDRLKRDRR